MDVNSTRFGRLEMDPDDVIRFPSGLPGLVGCQSWILLTDAEDDALAWLQCTDKPEIALAVVAPARFVPGYRLQIPRTDLEPLALTDISQALVLVILSSHQGMMTVNLKAPLVVNPTQRLGRQVIASGDQPVRYVLEDRSELRKSA